MTLHVVLGVAAVEGFVAEAAVDLVLLLLTGASSGIAWGLRLLVVGLLLLLVLRRWLWRWIRMVVVRLVVRRVSL